MKKVNKIDLDLLKAKKKDKLLDIGCSSGEQAIEIAKQGIFVYGIDCSGDYIKHFKNKLTSLKLECFPKKGSATNLPYQDNFFDCLVATEVFEHIINVEKAVGEAIRVLKKGGRICVSVPTQTSERLFQKIHPFYKKDSQHVNIFSKNEIISLLEKVGFKVIKVEKENFEWALFWLIHSLFKTRFNDCGVPGENQHVSDKYLSLMRFLSKMRLYNLAIKIGNLIFPKSYYIYALKYE